MLHNSILARRYNEVVISAIQDVMVFSEREFEQLPGEGRWEVVDGRAILLPPSEYEHQNLSDALVGMFRLQLKALECGIAVSATNVFLPRAGWSYSVDSKAVSRTSPFLNINRSGILASAPLRIW